MKRWLRELLAPRIVVEKAGRISNAEVTRILQGTPKEHRLFVAFMQLIEDAREEAIRDLAQDVTSATAMAMHSGGARYLKAVRDDILRRQAAKRGGAPNLASTPASP